MEFLCRSVCQSAFFPWIYIGKKGKEPKKMQKTVICDATYV